MFPTDQFGKSAKVFYALFEAKEKVGETI